MNKNIQNKDLEFIRKILEGAADDETDLGILTELRGKFIDVFEYREIKAKIKDVNDTKAGVDKMLETIVKEREK